MSTSGLHDGQIDPICVPQSFTARRCDLRQIGGSRSGPEDGARSGLQRVRRQSRVGRSFVRFSRFTRDLRSAVPPLVGAGPGSGSFPGSAQGRSGWSVPGRLGAPGGSAAGGSRSVEAVCANACLSAAMRAARTSGSPMNAWLLV
jgi:hypothetical protein